MLRLNVYTTLLLLGLMILEGVADMPDRYPSNIAEVPTLRENTTIYRDTVPIAPRSSWRAAVARPYKKHVPVQITVHHEGVSF